jgi:hypothetical protein
VAPRLREEAPRRGNEQGTKLQSRSLQERVVLSCGAVWGVVVRFLCMLLEKVRGRERVTEHSFIHVAEGWRLVRSLKLNSGTLFPHEISVLPNGSCTRLCPWPWPAIERPLGKEWIYWCVRSGRCETRVRPVTWLKIQGTAFLHFRQGIVD